MSKHTPGPWVIATTGAMEIATLHLCSNQPTEDGLGQRWVYIKADGGRDYRAVEDVEQDANARLIAAAPDLLAALEWTMDTLSHLGVGYLPGDKAIRKATEA